MITFDASGVTFQKVSCFRPVGTSGENCGMGGIVRMKPSSPVSLLRFIVVRPFASVFLVKDDYSEWSQ